MLGATVALSLYLEGLQIQHLLERRLYLAGGFAVFSD